MRRTKIVCTLGPASADEKTMKELLLSGMNVARLNFSHGTHESHKEMIELFRSVRDKLRIPAAVLLDTKGPEIRTKSFKNKKVHIKQGQDFIFTSEDIEGDENIVSVTYKDLPGSLKKGDRVLVDDGRFTFNVVNTDETRVYCVAATSGEMLGNRSINLPGVKLDFEYLSEKDRNDLIFGIENDVDFVAASFTRKKEDVIELRKFLDYYGGHRIKIISKIENSEGVENFDEILQYSDGIMVARGDMGVEIEYEKLPGIQKKFIRKCYQSGKMVITATQMLESMIQNTTPTRAEITDVANAVFDGTSAVMLSGETAMGAHPALVVKVMSKIVEQAETDAFEMKAYSDIQYDIDFNDTTNAICDAACTTARDLHAKAIIAVTKEGTAARRMSKFRPDQPIVASTPDTKTYHQLALSWGVFPVLARSQDEFDVLLRHAIDCAKQIDVVSSGDTVVISAGAPLNISGLTNTLRVTTIK